MKFASKCHTKERVEDVEQKKSYDLEHLYQFLQSAKSEQFNKLKQQCGVDSNLRTWAQEQQICEKGEFRLNESLRMGEPFSGQDVVTYQERPIWVMNYLGNALEENEKLEPDMILELLRMSLFAVCKVGGMNGWVYRERGSCLYMVCCYGGCSMYNGKGYVYKEGRKMYYFTYYGGTVSD